MGNLKITSQRGGFNTMGAGKHIIEITGAAITLSEAGHDQLKVTGKNANGETITHYYNTVQFEKNADSSYKLDKRGNRILSKENKSLDILGKLAFNAGIPEDEEFDSLNELKDALLGREVGIAVVLEVATKGKSEGKSFSRIAYTFTPQVELEEAF